MSVLVSLLMIFTFALPAFADSATPQAVATYSIKINKAAGTYKAYQDSRETLMEIRSRMLFGATV